MDILDKIIAAAFKFFAKKEKRPRRNNAPKKHLKMKRPASRRSPKTAKKRESRKGSRSVPKPKSKKSVKKLLKKNAAPKKSAIQEERIGAITHYFSRIQVVVIKLTKELKVGDKIRIKGNSTNFVQLVKSLQIESVDVKAAKKGELVGLKVEKNAKEGDLVFRLK